MATKTGATGKVYTTNAFGTQITVKYKDGSTRTVKKGEASWDVTKSAMDKDVADYDGTKGHSSATAQTALGSGWADADKGKITQSARSASTRTQTDQAKALQAAVEAREQAIANVTQKQNPVQPVRPVVQQPVQQVQPVINNEQTFADALASTANIAKNVANTPVQPMQNPLSNILYQNINSQINSIDNKIASVPGAVVSGVKSGVDTFMNKNLSPDINRVEQNIANTATSVKNKVTDYANENLLDENGVLKRANTNDMAKSLQENAKKVSQPMSKDIAYAVDKGFMDLPRNVEQLAVGGFALVSNDWNIMMQQAFGQDPEKNSQLQKKLQEKQLQLAIDSVKSEERRLKNYGDAGDSAFRQTARELGAVVFRMVPAIVATVAAGPVAGYATIFGTAAGDYGNQALMDMYNQRMLEKSEEFIDQIDVTKYAGMNEAQIQQALQAEFEAYLQSEPMFTQDEMTQANLYMLGGGALEAGSEMIGGIPGTAAKGAVGKVLVGAFGKKATKAAVVVKEIASTNLGKKVIDLMDIPAEALEEVIVTVAEPTLARMTYNPDADDATIEDISRDAFMGALAAIVLRAGMSAATGGKRNEMITPDMITTDMASYLSNNKDLFDISNDALQNEIDNLVLDVKIMDMYVEAGVPLDKTQQNLYIQAKQRIDELDQTRQMRKTGLTKEAQEEMRLKAAEQKYNEATQKIQELGAQIPPVPEQAQTAQINPQQIETPAMETTIPTQSQPVTAQPVQPNVAQPQMEQQQAQVQQPKMEQQQTPVEAVKPNVAQPTAEGAVKQKGVNESNLEDFDTSKWSADSRAWFERMQKISGVNIRVVKGMDVTENGMYDGKNTIYINGDKMTSFETIRKVTGHEVYHYLKETNQHKDIQDLARDMWQLEHPGRDFQEYLDKKERTYAKAGLKLVKRTQRPDGRVDIDDSALWDEAGAEFVERLFTDERMARRIAGEKPTLAERFVESLERLQKKIGVNPAASAQEAQMNEIINTAADMYKTALRDTKFERKPERAVDYTPEENAASETRFSIGTITSDDGTVYDNAVLLDTDIYDGIKPRDWERKLESFIKEHYAGKEFPALDSDGNVEWISVAREDERVKKEGSKRGHKAISDLYENNANNALNLTSAHLPEVIYASSPSDESNSENTHGWLDKNGWEFRHAYVVDRKGSIFRVELNIGLSDGGRKIIYAFNKPKKVGIGNVASMQLKAESAYPIKTNFKESMPQKGKPVNKKDGRRASIDEAALDADYMAAVNSGDMETAQRMVDEAAERWARGSDIRDNKGKLLKVYHGTPRQFTAFNDPRHTPYDEAGEFYFTPWKSKAEQYGENVRAFYLNIEFPETLDYEYDEDGNYVDTIITSEYDERDGTIMFPSYLKDDIRQDKEGGTEIVAYYPDQIKSADPVTYDDNGNVIPLSERFKSGNDDIRYSIDENGEDVGYHAGDLGKAEYLSRQSAGRDTGHYGTGTYFVGENEILDKSGSTYAERPRHKVVFSNYNLYKPKDSRQGYELHDFLRGVDGFFDRAENLIQSEEEGENLIEQLNELNWDIETTLENAESHDEIMDAEIEFLDGLNRVSPGLGYSNIADKSQYMYSSRDDFFYDWNEDGNSINKNIPLETVISSVPLDSIWRVNEDSIDEAKRYISRDRYFGMYEDWNGSMDQQASKLFGISKAKARGIIKEISDEIAEADYSYEDMKRADSAATRFMKKLGYEGVDVRGIPELDNTMYGSVIYDLRNEDVRYSLDDVDPVEPSSGKWTRSMTTSEVKAVHPDLWDVSSEENEDRNPTQIATTVNTYNKVYDILKAQGFTGKILDASSGLGLGTRSGRENYGFEVDDIEPFADQYNYMFDQKRDASKKISVKGKNKTVREETLHPKYTDYSELNNQYDAIISNAVLNVLPQDQRDALVVKMGELLADGGKMYINVRGKDVFGSTSEILNRDNMEIFVPGDGSYQKGFKQAELNAYLEDALGPDFTVETAKGNNKFGSVAAIVTKKGTNESFNDRYSLDEDYLAAVESGNMEEAQRLVDEAANRAGYAKVAYHGTSNQFNSFDSERIENGSGFWFSEDKATAEGYVRGSDNGKVVSAYLDLGRNLSFDAMGAGWDYIDANDLSFESNGNLSEDEINRINEKIREEVQWNYDFMDEEDEPDYVSTNALSFIGSDLGFDSVTILNVADPAVQNEHIVFDPSRIKSADPVTYDDNGNVIPLSERFNQQNDDLRYSVDSEGNDLTPEQQEFFKDSKARDENGNLLVLYHGTKSAGFTSFQEPRNNRSGIFLTNDRGTSETYSGFDAEDFIPDKKMTLEELQSIVDGYTNGDTEVYSGDDGAVYIREVDDDGEGTRFENVSDAQAYFIDNYMDTNDNPGVYALYANITNPFVFEGGGRDYATLYEGDPEDVSAFAYVVARPIGNGMYDVKGFNAIDFTEISRKMSTSEIRKTFGDRADDVLTGEEQNSIVIDKAGNTVRHYTDDWVEYARENGYDGVIFRDIVDGGFEEADVYVVFDPNQVKSVANENPTSDPDIRYSIDELDPDGETTGTVYNEDGDVLVEQRGSDVRFNLYTYENGGREKLVKYMYALRKKNDITEQQMQDILNNMDELHDAIDEIIATGQYENFGKWEDVDVRRDVNGNPIMCVIKSNGDYAMNLDFSQRCAKRVAADTLMQYMAENNIIDKGITELTPADYAIINEEIARAGFDIACTMCFVETRRDRTANWARKVASEFNALFEAADIKNGRVNKAKMEAKAHEMSKEGSGNKDNPSMATLRKYMKAIETDALSAKRIDAAKLMYSEGMMDILTDNPSMYTVLAGRNGTSNLKPFLPENPYYNELITNKKIGMTESKKTNPSKWDPKKAFAIGGVRLQSFSDYRENMFFDYAQMFAELAAKGMPIQSYTKVVSFVEMFGMTGAKINMSLVPGTRLSDAYKTEFNRIYQSGKNGKKKLESDPRFQYLREHAGLREVNGEWVYDWAVESFGYDNGLTMKDKEGIPEAAWNLMHNKDYSPSCGTIAIGVSDMQIWKMMFDDNIPMIIPYHKSNINPDVARAKNIDFYSDYTAFQGDKYQNLVNPYLKKGMTPEQQQKAWTNFYWDIVTDGKYQSIGGGRYAAKALTDTKLKGKTFDFYADLAKTGDPVQTAQNYVEYCQKTEDPDNPGHFILPKFPQFVYLKEDMRLRDPQASAKAGKAVYRDYKKGDYNPYYYKLLEDFSLYDNVTFEYSPQKAVQFGKDNVPADWKEKLQKGLAGDVAMTNSGDIKDVKPKVGSYEWKEERAGRARAEDGQEVSDDIKATADKIAERLRNNEYQSENADDEEDDGIRASIDENAVNDRWNQMNDQYGSMEPGESPTGEERNIDYPSQPNDFEKSRRFGRTAAEARTVDDETVDKLKEEYTSDISSGRLTYEPVSNKETLSRAKKRISKSGWKNAVDEIHGKVIGGDRLTAEDIATAELCIQNAQMERDHDAAADIIADLAVIGTEYGQAIQALSLLKRLDPNRQLRVYDNIATRINRQIMKRNNYREEELVTITPEIRKQLREARGSKRRDEIFAQEIARAAAASQGTWTEKLDALRYAAMLSNPKTHIRNMIGNFAMQAVLIPRNVVSGALQDARNLAAFKVQPKGFEQTHSLRNRSTSSRKELLEYVQYDYDNYGMQVLSNEGSRYNDATMNQYNSQKRVFGRGPVGNVAEALAGNAPTSVGSMLEREDMWFKQMTYKTALRQYMQANGISVEEAADGVEKENGASIAKGRQYAMEQARKATFTEENKFAENLSKLENTNMLSKVLLGGMIPFKKTPMNIVTRGVELSPAGIVMTGYKLVNASINQERMAKGQEALPAKNGKVYTMNDVCDSFAMNLAGVGLIRLGIVLAEAGFLVASGGDDDDKASRYETQTGAQHYAIVDPETGDSWTIDWMAPVVMPIMMGVELFNEFFNTEIDDERDPLTRLLAATTRIADPVFEMSCMQGVAEVLSSFSGDAAEIASTVGNKLLTGYAQQFVPQPVAATARTMDDSIYSTYAPKDSKVPLAGKQGEKLYRQNIAKLPGGAKLSEKVDEKFGNGDGTYKLQPSIDRWGNERKREYAGSGVEQTVKRGLNTFANPASYASNKDTDLDTELRKLYKETGDSRALPTTSIPSNVTIDKVKYNLSPVEYTRYATTAGKSREEYFRQFIESEAYSQLSNADKVDIIADLSTLANAKANAEFAKNRNLEYEMTKKQTEALESGNPAKYMADNVMEENAKTEAFESAMKGINWTSKDYDKVDKLVTNAGNKEAKIAKLDGLKKDGTITADQYWYYRLKDSSVSPSSKDIIACGKEMGKNYPLYQEMRKEYNETHKSKI